MQFWQCEGHDYTTSGGFHEADAVIVGSLALQWLWEGIGVEIESACEIWKMGTNGEGKRKMKADMVETQVEVYFEPTGRRKKRMEIGYSVIARENLTILS